MICRRKQGKLVKQGCGGDHQSCVFQALIAALSSATLQHCSVALGLPFSVEAVLMASTWPFLP